MYDFVDDTPKKVKAAEVDEALVGAVESNDSYDSFEDTASETRHSSELSIDLFGKSHPDALYRAAGGESADQGAVMFGCPCCGRSVGRVLRVRATANSTWMAVCAMCAASTLDRYPEALIGGVVRSGRRRRRRSSEQRRTMRDAG
jgi:predicted RNA-binding Zn-ribbon protein involved in translation (DUF1610 family)